MLVEVEDIDALDKMKTRRGKDDASNVEFVWMNLYFCVQM